MKGAEPFSKKKKQLILSSKTWCPFTHGVKISYDCYIANPAVTDLLQWEGNFLVCGKFLDSVRGQERLAGCECCLMSAFTASFDVMTRNTIPGHFHHNRSGGCFHHFP